MSKIALTYIVLLHFTSINLYNMYLNTNRDNIFNFCNRYKNSGVESILNFLNGIHFKNY